MTHEEIKKLEESFDRYKKALVLVYADGDVTSVERNRLISLKNELGLSDSDCMVMEARFHETADQDGIKWEELKDRHHCHLCDSDGKIRWNGIDHSMLEYIELGDTYIEASNGSSYTGLREPFVLSIGQSFEELLDEYSENHIYDAIKDGRLQVFDEQKDLETFLKLKFDILNEEILLSEYFDSYIHSNEFIENFGDWEKAVRLEKLADAPAIIKSGRIIIDGEDITEEVNNFRDDKDNKVLRIFAKDIGRLVKGTYHNDDLNIDVTLSMGNIDEIKNHHMAMSGHLEAIQYIPDIIKQGIYIAEEPNEDKNKHPNIENYKYFVSALNIGGTDYTCEFAIGVDKDGNHYYDQRLSQIEKGLLLDNLSQLMSRGKSEQSLMNYDKRLLRICQCPQAIFLDEDLLPSIETVKAVIKHEVFLEKDENGFQLLHDNRINRTFGKELSEMVIDLEKLENPNAEYLKKIKGIVSDSQVLENPMLEHGSSPKNNIQHSSPVVNSKMSDWEMKYSSLSAEKLISFISDEAFTKEMAAFTLADFEGNGTPLVIDELGNVCEKNIWESKEENAIVDYMPSGILTKEIEIIEDFLTGHTDIPAKQRVEVLKLKDSLEEINDRLIIKEEKSEEQKRRSSRSDKEIVKDYLDRIKDNLPPSDRNIVDEVMKASSKALADFTAEEKKVIGKYLMENGAKDQKSLGNLLKKKVEPEHNHETNRDIERGR